MHSNQPDELEEAIMEAVRLFREAGAPGPSRGRSTTAGWIARERGDLGAAESASGSRSACSSRSVTARRSAKASAVLAQLLLERGKIEEAERYALDARETVGAQDITSLSTTAFALGLVRAAQGRDEEAEELLRDGDRYHRADGLPRDPFRCARAPCSLPP